MSRRPSAVATVSEDVCPICKTSRYVNKGLEFLIHPDCYHPMCRDCVERVFHDGPAQCPTAGCTRTLRRKGFRSAFFGDLTVEREVDVRRRVGDVFNRTEDDFETVQAYNDYSEMLDRNPETRRSAEEELARWREQNRGEIERNRRAGQKASLESRTRQEAELQATREKRLNFLRDAEEQRRQDARDREMLLDNLASAPEGTAKVILKKRTRGNAARLRLNEVDNDERMADLDAPKLTIQGLKEKKKPAPPQGPYDPFGGMNHKPGRFVVTADLVNPWEHDKHLDSTILTGGYNFMEWTTRAMFEAFEGLGAFIEEEKSGQIPVKQQVS
jgi:CDK-activating kinase assembly factor MAT1